MKEAGDKYSLKAIEFLLEMGVPFRDYEEILLYIASENGTYYNEDKNEIMIAFPGTLDYFSYRVIGNGIVSCYRKWVIKFYMEI